MINNEDNEKIACYLLNTAKDYRKIYLEIKNNDQKTALSLACEYGNIKLVQILLYYKANLNNYMPIHMAIKSGNIDIIQLLIEYQIDLRLINFSKENSLHIACKYNRYDILEILINYRMDLEVQDNQGYTPLLTASYFNHYNCIKILLRNQANIQAIDNHKKNILHICVERHCLNALQIYLEWIKKDINSYHIFFQEDRYGNTVLHAGIHRNLDKIFQTCSQSIYPNYFYESI